MIIYDINDWKLYDTCLLVDKNKYKKKVKKHVLRFLIKHKYAGVNSEEFSFIFKICIEMLKEYVKYDKKVFTRKRDLISYISICGLTSFWIAYKFISDNDDVALSDLEDITGVSCNKYLEIERDILQAVKYEVFRIMKKVSD
jgi:hypothetical protein